MFYLYDPYTYNFINLRVYKVYFTDFLLKCWSYAGMLGSLILKHNLKFFEAIFSLAKFQI